MVQNQQSGTANKKQQDFVNIVNLANAPINQDILKESVKTVAAYWQAEIRRLPLRSTTSLTSPKHNGPVTTQAKLVQAPKQFLNFSPLLLSSVTGNSPTKSD